MVTNIRFILHGGFKNIQFLNLHFTSIVTYNFRLAKFNFVKIIQTN